ncbi:MAG: hypothetical protein ACERKZ_05380 [Lachnotalea sp.]
MLPRIILTGCQIICSKIVTADITLSADVFIFIKGIVYSPKGEPLPNAAVEILVVDNCYVPAIEKSLGVTFTVADGSYGISLPRIDKEYKLVAYSSV